MELAALRRRFLYFPLAEHFEQYDTTRRFEARGIGQKMDFHQTSPATLTQQIIRHIGSPVTYPPINIDGAETAAQMILKLI